MNPPDARPDPNRPRKPVLELLRDYQREFGVLLDHLEQTAQANDPRTYLYYVEEIVLLTQKANEIGQRLAVYVRGIDPDAAKPPTTH